MSNPRLPTPKLRQIIQFESSKLSAREVGRALSLSHGVGSKYRCAVRAAGVSWEDCAATGHPAVCTKPLLEPNAQLRYEITREDLPLACPSLKMSLWNSHPRV